MEDLAHMGSGEADLVAVAAVAGSGALGDDALRELALHGLAYGLVYVAGAGHAHGLIDVASSAQRVADCAAEAGGCAAEGFYFSGVVVCFVLEHQEPLLLAAVFGVDVDDD